MKVYWNSYCLGNVPVHLKLFQNKKFIKNKHVINLNKPTVLNL